MPSVCRHQPDPDRMASFEGLDRIHLQRCVIGPQGICCGGNNTFRRMCIPQVILCPPLLFYIGLVGPTKHYNLCSMYECT